MRSFRTGDWPLTQAGTLVKAPVQTGLRTATEIEITSGLTGDDQLVGSNLAAYRDGQRVEVTLPKPQ